MLGQTSEIVQNEKLVDAGKFRIEQTSYWLENTFFEFCNENHILDTVFPQIVSAATIQFMK